MVVLGRKGPGLWFGRNTGPQQRQPAPRLDRRCKTTPFSRLYTLVTRQRRFVIDALTPCDERG